MTVADTPILFLRAVMEATIHRGLDAGEMIVRILRLGGSSGFLHVAAGTRSSSQQKSRARNELLRSEPAYIARRPPVRVTAWLEPLFAHIFRNSVLLITWKALNIPNLDSKIECPAWKSIYMIDFSIYFDAYFWTGVIELSMKMHFMTMSLKISGWLGTFLLILQISIVFYSSFMHKYIR